MEKRFKNWVPPTFDEHGMTRWNWMCQHPENLKMGKYVDIGAFSYLNAKHGITIEDWVQLGSHCSVYSLSTIDNKHGTVTLKRNCRIGTHSSVMPGVTIGENSVIGAYSFVTSSIPKNTLAVGVPAKAKRPLTAQEIKDLLNEAIE